VDSLPTVLAPSAANRETFARPHDVHRLVCVSPLDAVSDGKGVPLVDMFASSFARLYYESVKEMLPLLAAVHHYPSRAVELGDPGPGEPAPRSGIELSAAYLCVFAPIVGPLVVALAFDFRASDLHSSIPLIRHTCRQRDQIRLSGKEVPVVACAGRDVTPEELRFGPEVHQLLFPARHGDSLLTPSGEADEDLLERLVGRRDDVSPAQHTFERPVELNKTPREVGAVKSGVSVIWTDDPDLEHALTLSTVQCLTGLSELRRIRAEARTALDDFRTTRNEATEVRSGDDRDRRRDDPGKQRQALVGLSAHLQDLELRLSFGVEAYMDIRLLVPERMVEKFHDTLAAQVGLPAALRSTDRMLTRLVTVVKTAHESVSDAERRRDEWRQLKLAAIGAVALPLVVIFGYLGSNTSELAKPRSILDFTHFGIAYVALIGLTVAIYAAVSALATLERNRREGLLHLPRTWVPWRRHRRERRSNGGRPESAEQPQREADTATPSGSRVRGPQAHAPRTRTTDRS
jgi:hypothetical protein